MGIVSSRDDDERREEAGASGQLIDFDPTDPDIVKVFYDLSEWTFDQRGELSELLAERSLPHDWDADELVVPEEIEATMDAIFVDLEQRFGPFPITLDSDAPATEYGLDEWTDRDRRTLTDALVAAEIPHRWEDATVVVARDAESAVDDLLDAIEAGELVTAPGDDVAEPPDGILSTLFGVADELARDPLDMRARNQLLDLQGALDPNHPPYAFAPRTWATALDRVEAIATRMATEGGAGIGVGGDDGGIATDADALRTLLRPFV